MKIERVFRRDGSERSWENQGSQGIFNVIP